MRVLFAGAVFLLSLLMPAALSAEPPACAVEGPPAKSGLVFVVEGIGGLEVFNTTARWALPRAGVAHEIRDFTWTHGRGHFLKDLQDIRHLLRKADQLAEEVRQYKRAHPDRPVYLIGRSGGAGLVLAVAEQLPPGVLERIILVSAAVSPDYDLRPALRATQAGIVSFHSTHDRLILNWGTQQFGTVDRVYGPSAGMNGFTLPKDLPDEDHALYERLVQVGWKPKMILEGNLGTHTGAVMPRFLGKEIAPWLKP